MRPVWIAALIIVAVALGIIGARVAHPLPSLDGRPPSSAYEDTADTRLGRSLAPLVAAHPGEAGVYPLANAGDAFAARMLLASNAQRSLDVEYYIWRNDTTGTLLFDALRAAADRGVRVRLLLDDNNTPGLDEMLAALDAHPSIEVRLFNPFVIRTMRWLGFVMDFARLNRRMHNKSFTVDNQATIVGGRNVGDEYFDAAPEGELVFSDLDVILVGAIVQEVSRDFDRYWASGSAYPIDRLVPPVPHAALESVHERAVRLERDAAAAEYVGAVGRSPFVDDLLAGRLAFEWAPAHMLSDDPAKGLGLAAPEEMLPHKLVEAIGRPRAALDLVSPYFVPTAAGVDAFADLAAAGVDVRLHVK
jgi:putative cardiolipin synthase